MEQLWIAPAAVASTVTSSRKGPSLDRNRIRVASEFAPQTSPAPAGNAIVPAGYIRQMGDEGENDMALGDTRNGALQADATFTPITVPIASGGWPPLPAGYPQNP
jgi:hypothetical protein